MISLLHITNGESAGNTLRQTALGGAVMAWQDVLHEGPVPALPRQQLLRTRARFLAGCGCGREQALLASLERRDRQLVEALHGDVQVVLWFEHDLYDQLQLLDVLALARTEEAAPELIGSPPAPPRLPPPSSQRNDSKRPHFSGTPGSTGLSRWSGKERRGSWKPTPARHFLRRLHSATASASHDSSCS